MKKYIIEMLCAMAYWFIASILMFLALFTVGIYWFAILAASLYYPYYKLMKWLTADEEPCRNGHDWIPLKSDLVKEKQWCIVCGQKRTIRGKK